MRKVAVGEVGYRCRDRSEDPTDSLERVVAKNNVNEIVSTE